MDQNLELGVWIGIAGIALIWANLLLWRTRHTLKRLRQKLDVPDGALVPATLAMPDPVAEMATSVPAP